MRIVDDLDFAAAFDIQPKYSEPVYTARVVSSAAPLNTVVLSMYRAVKTGLSIHITINGVKRRVFSLFDMFGMFKMVSFLKWYKMRLI